jgi:hypothetical protein
MSILIWSHLCLDLPSGLFQELNILPSQSLFIVLLLVKKNELLEQVFPKQAIKVSEVHFIM